MSKHITTGSQPTRLISGRNAKMLPGSVYMHRGITRCGQSRNTGHVSAEWMELLV